MVGDHRNDMLAGRAAGLKTIAVDFGHSAKAIAEGPDRVIRSFAELPGAVASLLRA